MLFIFRLDVTLYYDDKMKNLYGSNAKTEEKLRSVMAYVEEMFLERDTLTTVVKIDAEKVNIIHASGHDWESGMRWVLNSVLIENNCFG